MRAETIPAYGFGTFLQTTFEDALTRVTEALKEEGFGVLSTIDVAATLRARLGLEMPPYTILGACNPLLAHQALEAEPVIGLLLPCNVVVRVVDAGVQVAIADPVAMMELAGNPALQTVAAEAKTRLERVVARLRGAQ